MCNKMSDVRLSNASPTVERVDARQPENIRPSVRRMLFGRPDPEQIRGDVSALIQEEVRRVVDEYNFDPVTERPLTPRNYEWQVDSDPPEFFRRPPHGSQRPGDDTRQEAEERSDGRSDRRGSRKRHSGASGPCSGECPSKRSHSDGGDDDDDDDDDDEGKSGGAVNAAEERPSRPEQSAEVR